MFEPEKNAEIIDRIKYLMREMGLKQTQLSKRIGVDTSNLSKYMNARMPLSESFINRLVVNMGVNKQWLIDGTDTPFEKTPVHIDSNQSQMMLLNGAVAAGGAGTPVYDIDATAGTADRRTELFDNDHIVGWVNLPAISPDCRIVRVSGDSMSPVIYNGDYVAVRKVANMQQIFWGQIYIVTLEDFRVVKYVRRHTDPQMVVLRSENPNYDDMEVLRSDIRDMLLVQHVMHVSTRL